MADVNISKYRASVVRSGSAPATPGFVVSEGQNPVEPAGSEQNHLPVTINATANALAITTDQVLSGAGTVGQYIRGDGSLADFPASTGGGSSVSYYLNGSISQGTISGVAYKELSKVPILGTGTDFTINADGYIAQFLTDAGDPGLLEIPGGNWNFETYFSASSGGGSPTFYVELYKYDGSTFTLIASNSGNPELIAFGTNVTSYFSTLAVPTTALTLTDRLAIRYHVTHSGRTITLHTENNHLCQVITTFTTGLTALNGLTAQVQYFAVGTSGTDFNIASVTATHTFNLPTASATNRGALSAADWSTFNSKQNALTLTTTGTSGAATLIGSTLNIPQYQSVLTNPITGTGTTNYLPKFTSTSSIGNSLVYDNGTTVLIGTTSTPTPVAGVNFPLSVTSSEATRIRIDSSRGAPNYANAGVGLYASGVQKWSFAHYSTDSGANYDFTIYNDALTSSAILVKGSNSNVLIGTTTDGGQKLQVTGTFALRASASISSATQIPIFNADPSGTTRELVTRTPAQLLSDIGGQAALTNPVTGTGTTNYLPKFTGSTTIGNSNLINDASGNLGLGVTPSAGGLAGYALFQIAAHGTSIYSGTNQTLIGTNVLWSGGSASYSASTFATLYNQQSGQHQWFNAPSGTAGNAISFTQAMTLTSGGNLLVGTTTDNGAKLQVSGAGTFTGTGLLASVRINNTTASTGKDWHLYSLNNGNFGLYNNTDGSYAYQVTPSGNVGIGTSSPQAYTNFTTLSVDNPTNGGVVSVRYNGTAYLNLYTAFGEGRVEGANGSFLTFRTTDTERMRITSGGNVFVNSTSGYTNTGRIGVVVNGSSQAIFGLQTGGNNKAYFYNDGSNTLLYSEDAGGYMAFGTANTERMRITSGGNVLIGTTTNGSSKLKINGLPTSSAGLASGDVWNDGGTLKIA